MTRSLDQICAEFAWQRLQPKANGDYVNLAKSMPAMVMESGLMPALAFLEGKKDDHHKMLLRHILEWLKAQRVLNTTDFRGAMNELLNKSSLEYQRAVEEAMRVLKWIRHFGDALKSQGGSDAK